jgi:dolichol-phosphate mannosyltransferase
VTEPAADPPAPVLSVVVPLLNEEEVLDATYTRLTEELEKIGEPYEIVFVDDGSTDRSRAILAEKTSKDARVRLLTLSRNFGHEMATTAGLHHARGRAAIVIDADLQDPPEVMAEFVRLWHEGHQVVYGVRQKREGETLMKRLTAFLFYRLMRFLSDTAIPADTGDFRLLDRRVLDVYRELNEDPRFFRGLSSWVGFKQVGVPFVRRPRAGGVSKYRPTRLLRLAFDTITSFSTYTALLGTVLAILLALASFTGIAVAVILAALGQIHLAGWMWAALGFVALWNVQFVYLAVLGEYLVRTHRHTQRRPLYVVDQLIERGRDVRAAGGA